MFVVEFGKFNYAVIFLAAMIFTAIVIEVLGLGFVLPVSGCDLKLTTQDKGMLSGAAFAGKPTIIPYLVPSNITLIPMYLLGLIVPSLLWGYLADTKGRKKVMKTTLLIAFICSVMSSFSNGFWSFLILRFLTGFL